MSIIKDLFTKVTKEDKAMFYTFERIYLLAPKHYVIHKCTKGFMVLMKKSNIICDIRESECKIETKGNSRLDVDCDSVALAEVLSNIIKKQRGY